jgi:FKBP-type peptidyl-prolyl cis-trans isomerase 2
MAQAKAGDIVRVNYTGRLEDGTIIDSTVNREPVQFTIGAGEVITGIEQAVTGMEPGDCKSATIPPEQAFGPRRDELVTTLDRDVLPKEVKPVIGQQLAVQQRDGRHFKVTVTDVSERAVVVDANHALAGRHLVLDLELVEVAQAS